MKIEILISGSIHWFDKYSVVVRVRSAPWGPSGDQDGRPSAPCSPPITGERPRLKLTAPRSGAKLLPARFLNAFLVTAGALQTDPCPQGGTQMRRTRVKKKGGGQPRRTPQWPPLSASLRPATRPRPGRRLRLSPLRGGRPAKRFQTCLGPIPEGEAIPLAHAAGGPFI